MKTFHQECFHLSLMSLSTVLVVCPPPRPLCLSSITPSTFFVLSSHSSFPMTRATYLSTSSVLQEAGQAYIYSHWKPPNSDCCCCGAPLLDTTQLIVPRHHQLCFLLYNGTESRDFNIQAKCTKITTFTCIRTSLCPIYPSYSFLVFIQEHRRESQGGNTYGMTKIRERCRSRLPSKASWDKRKSPVVI